MQDKLHLTCSCHCHELHIEKDPDESLWYGSFWIRGYGQTPGWLYRLKCIWKIIRTGVPYGDEIVMERPQLEELRDYIDSQLK